MEHDDVTDDVTSYLKLTMTQSDTMFITTDSIRFTMYRYVSVKHRLVSDSTICRDRDRNEF